MRKTNRNYYFLVEGETEQLYLKWLQKQINNDSKAKIKVDFRCKIGLSPISYVKQLNVLDKEEVNYLLDIESNSTEHVTKFEKALSNLKKAGLLGKKVKFWLGYSNFTFELWLILHKHDCFSSLNNRKDYLKYINKYFNSNFERLKDYKKEENFCKLLEQLTINDIKKAIIRSNNIMNHRMSDSIITKSSNFEYCKNNPSLSIHKIIEKILIDVYGKNYQK